MKAWGCFYMLVGALVADSSLSALMAIVNGATETWWPMLTLGASILLFVDGIRAFIQRIKEPWPMLLAGAIPLLLSSIFGEWPLRIWISSTVLIGSHAAAARLCIVIRRDGIAAFVSCIVIVAALADSTWHLFIYYWIGWWNATSQLTPMEIVGFMLPALIPWPFLLVMLVHAANEVFRAPHPKTTGQAV